MSKKDKFLNVFSIPFLGLCYWLIAEALGGWHILAGVMAFIAISGVIMAGCMAAVMAIIYYLTIFQSNRYAKHLRDAGYSVYLDKHQVWQFSGMILMVCMFTPMTILVTGRFWEIHTCIQAKECVAVNGWYIIAPFMGFMLWLIALTSIYAAVSMWWQSFRPLRQHYKNLQLGYELDLPQLPER